MKKYLNAVLVVEGKEDASYLSNYIESEIVVINGYDIKDAIIDYLKGKRVIVLTDPDEAGKTIRNTLNQKLDNPINVEVDISKCTRGNKNGVAECEIDEILNKLSPYLMEKPENETIITVRELYSLGILKDKKLRDFICEKLHLGQCNNRMFCRRVNLNQVKLETLKELIKEYKNGN